MTQGRIWHALQPNQSMLTILVPCSFTYLLWPLCTWLIFVSTLGVFIKPQWNVRSLQSFYIFTRHVDLTCRLGNTLLHLITNIPYLAHICYHHYVTKLPLWVFKPNRDHILWYVAILCCLGLSISEHRDLKSSGTVHFRTYRLSHLELSISEPRDFKSSGTVHFRA